MAQSVLPHEITELIQRALYECDKNHQVHIRRTSLGWLHLSVVTSIFKNQSPPERENQIDEILARANLSLAGFPFIDYILLTPEESESIDKEDAHMEQLPLPLWSEILMAPEVDHPVSIEDETGKRPLITTFYSFKGGVGRTTALAFVASMLARQGYRVVLIDFDLEAPGLSLVLSSGAKSRYGVLDYIHQRFLTPDENLPNIVDCFYPIDLAVRGELYLVPAGEYDEGYIHRLADLDMRLLYQRVTNPFHQLLDDIIEELDPDIILIDARTGFTEMGAVALFDRADLGVICFSPTEQSYAGLQWVVRAASKQREYRGIPDLRFLLTPVPSVNSSQKQIWLGRTEEWITDHWEIPSTLTVKDIYAEVPYNPEITTLENLIRDASQVVLSPYRPIADAITASLPDKPQNNPTISDETRSNILQQLNFQAATAQEIDLDHISGVFQKTGDFPKFLEDRIWLVRGAKGTGKSLLFRLFVERRNAAIDIARPNVNLDQVVFVAGHGNEKLSPTLLNSGDLGSYENRVGEGYWTSFWRNYALIQLIRSLTDLQALSSIAPKLRSISSREEILHRDIVNWLVERAEMPDGATISGDELRIIDRWCQDNNQSVWLLYDELDAGFGPDYERRRRSLEALFGWWAEIGANLSFIHPKLLLREDIWTDLNFNNKAHFGNRSILLRWEEDDLWRLVLRQALRSSDLLKDLVRNKTGVQLDWLDSVEIDQLRRSLYPLWGERMGRGNKSYTHNWVRNRITDSRKNRFPRSLIAMLREAIQKERIFPDRHTYNSVLRPRSLMDAMPVVSRERVDEVRNEYPEFENRLDKLNGERLPIPKNRLGEIWHGEIWHLEETKLVQTINDMIEAGILEEYQRGKPTDIPRYSVAELYLSGLGMTRKGQR
jgi:MinD-like ATPase involved in chromosome partitioning or flagellar assembly